ncbi:hypothetical protein HPP92_000052 [Vanilla planifolia]|uniref:Uncharacterized protein n=1 Tax=Vanilla planifolia TaxID=51239 RepID=A0A835S439_VANPL|nr:hypothetical protein HPP92_000052 [Vanilla planifolia]
MAILYAVVARGTVVLAEFAAVTGNTGAVARRIIEKLPPDSDSRLCFSQDRYIFHVLRADALTFLCMANDTFGSSIHTVMVDNIEKIMDRGDRIALLVDKTATMQDNTFHFKKQSKHLRQALWRKNAKLLALLTFIIFLLLYIIIAACCGGITLSSCRS